MAKLYWRIKRNGKWTWVAATSENSRSLGKYSFPNDVVYKHHFGTECIHHDDPGHKPEVYTDDES